jgi:hypothetical protein
MKDVLKSDPASRGLPKSDPASRGLPKSDPASRGLPKSDPASRGLPKSDPASRGPVFDKLRKILKRHAKGMVVVHDTAESYYLDTKMIGPNRKPIMFGAARLGKAYVSYYLFPVYVFPDLLKGMSPALKKRMQGKSCFNFTKVEEDLFEELAELTKKGLEAFKTRQLPQ